MNSKYIVLFTIFGMIVTLVLGESLTLRDLDDTDDSDSTDDDVNDEKRAIRTFLENNDDASQFLDTSRRLFSSQKSHMKEAKKKYEEKCERLLHPRYCPDLATWPAWNQAFNSATNKK